MTGTRPPASPARITALFEHLVIDDDTGLAWKREGLCSQADPDLFYPEKGTSVALPKRICAKCPVRVTCLNHALDHGEAHGIWGAATARERQRMLADRRHRRGAAA
ncbi:WhiB family transcriptional regulator [Rhodococcus zopfii]|uniref:WhiB family transcriptional regulator n=1 Tax=Rhodococcus zopfii TaxID=43772 RepID=UPI0009F9FAB9|nr:WhiB family transcriptional regulator [Rhodococcus zopfii]